jgi:hypothetical protein
MDKLQGTWKVVSLEIEGQAIPHGDAQALVSGTALETLRRV